MIKPLRKRILYVLRRTHRAPLSATELAQRLKAKPASVSSVLHKMWWAGEIGKEPCMGDTGRAWGYFV